MTDAAVNVALSHLMITSQSLVLWTWG